MKPDPIRLPFAGQIAFFRQKLNLPTERWDDIERAAHDRAFVVAGAMQADLLDGLRQAVDDGIARGDTLADFRKNFLAIVEKHGWADFTGDDRATQGRTGGRALAWRTRTIYNTNILTSYAAGRWQQLNDPELLKARPYWRYVHSDFVSNPRPQHKAWGDAGLTLPHDHPFWKTHFPPNGWGCRCSVKAVAAPKDGDATRPPDGWDTRDARGRLPGIDQGWDYAPGATWKPWDKMGGLPDCDGLAALAAGTSACLPPRPAEDQGNWKSQHRPDLRQVSREFRLPLPAVLPAAPTRTAAIETLATALGLSRSVPYRFVKTPYYGIVPLAFERLPHMVNKTEDARERYANFILPTLENPFEIYQTEYTDGTSRPRFIGLFDGPVQVMVVVRIDRDGRLFWNYMQSSEKKMNGHRLGVLVYAR